MLNTKNLEILSDSAAKTLAQLRINEGTFLFVEDVKMHHPTVKEEDWNTGKSLNPENEGSSMQTHDSLQMKWELEFELDQFRFIIKFNEPMDAKQSVQVNTATAAGAITAAQIQDSQ